MLATVTALSYKVNTWADFWLSHFPEIAKTRSNTSYLEFPDAALY